jgi:hypothetical protein
LAKDKTEMEGRLLLSLLKQITTEAYRVFLTVEKKNYLLPEV